ncbi:MAG: hypothetical protein WBF93_03510 [Pirellulales bacterium]
MTIISNPFQSPQYQQLATEQDDESRRISRFAHLGQVVVRWEKMRVFYNAILTLWVLLLMALRAEISNPPQLFMLAFCCVAANGCFLAGPLVEGYLCWFGIRNPAITWLLFVPGTLFSCGLALLAFTLIHSLP